MRRRAFDYKQLLEKDYWLKYFENLVTSTDNFYWQFIIIFSCLTLAYIGYKIGSKIIAVKLEKVPSKFYIKTSRLFNRYITPTLYPTIALTITSIAYGVCSLIFEGDLIIFIAAIKIDGLFIFLSLLKASSNNHLLSRIANFILIPTIILSIFNVLDPTIKFLDQLAFKFGDFRISVYTTLKASMALVVILWFANIITLRGKRYINSLGNLRPSTRTILGKTIDITIYSIAILTILKMFGVDLKAFAFVGGAVGVGIGFGLQKIASNFISGIILLFEKSVEIGDIVEIESGATLGTIKQFNSRFTLIESFDGKEILVPNEYLITSNVSNWTHSNRLARIEINFGVSYGSDLEKAMKLAKEVADAHPRATKKEPACCYITNFGDFDIQLMLHFWVTDMMEGRLEPKSDVMLGMWKKFKENGIEIPFPQREVRILNNDSSATVTSPQHRFDAA